MPRATLSNELKNAISDLSAKEKDKLLFRLLPRDQKLVHKLEYQLLEHSDTQEQRRDELRAEILDMLSVYPKYYYSPGYLLLTLREISGKITYHKDITLDKFGEIELNYLMLIEGIERNFPELRREGYFASKSFNEYVVKRIVKLIGLTHKLHEDYILEFEESMIKIAHLLSDLPTMKNFITENNLNINALMQGDLPELI